MNIKDCKLEGVKIIQPTVHGDDRGHFKEVFKAGIIDSFEVQQINQAYSDNLCIRGLHYQKSPYQQAKLVWVPVGEVIDIVVDINQSSPTFKTYETFKLSDKNHKILFIPKGYAHGYITVTKNTIFAYGLDEVYNPNYDAGINFNDMDVNIDLNYNFSKHLMSKKDKSLPFLKDISF